jgi:TPR repeat protein
MLFAAEGGNHVGQSFVGVLYYNGKGVAKNRAESLKWHLAAAEQGNLPSQIMIARMFEDGIGTAKNLKKSAHWYEAAAEQGDAGAQFELTKIYDYGTGVEKDFEKSFKWAKRAAEQGHKAAQFVVGLYYDYGKGTFENNAEAIKWYRIAAENDVHSAQWNLGLMYEQGEGTPADAIEAKKWFEIAASNGNENAQKKLLVLASEATPANTSDEVFIKSCPSMEETLKETGLEFGYNGKFWQVDTGYGEMFIDVNSEACSFRFTNFFFDVGTNLPLELLNDFNLKHSYGFLSQSDEAVIFEYFVILPNADQDLLTLNLAYFNIKSSKVEEYLINEQTKVAGLSS